MRRMGFSTAALLAVLVTLTACGSQPTPALAPTPAPTGSQLADQHSTPVSPGPSGVLRRWVGVACPRVGDTATTTSGGHLVCTQLAGDDVPRWHVDVRTQP